MIRTVLIEAKERADYVQHALDLVKPKTVLDLGAGHCKFSIQAVEQKYCKKVYAVDARTERVPKLPKGVLFSQGNVLESAWQNIGADLIMCLGLFYHLTIDEQELLLSKLVCSGATTILLDSHYITEEVCLESTSKSGVVYHGKPYAEGTKEDLLTRLKASATSTVSFWHVFPSLLGMLDDHFSEVRVILPESSPGRCFFLLEV